jgi:tRNA threonylcarbamoyladenosine biosynthesis protein TsaB
MFLGVDCSSVTAELALVTADGREFTAREDTPRQADVIFPLLEKLLQDAGITTQDLTAIGAITGPGSFTGIRVGLSLAQGLADGLGIPVYGFDAFTALSMGKSAITVLESKRAELYVQYDGKIEMLLPEQILKMANGKKIIHNTSHKVLGTPTKTSMAIAAALHARLGFQQKIPCEILRPFYVREADAKPSVT